MNNFTNIPVKLGSASFKQFAEFNIFQKQKLWKTPVFLGIFFAALSFFSFCMQEHSENAFLCGVLFFVVAFFIPGMYFKKFHASIKEQTTKMNLETPRLVYTVSLTEATEGIRYYHPGEKKPAGQFAWKKAEGAWRTKRAIYLYVDPVRALILPDSLKELDQDTIWSFLQKQLTEEKLHDVRNQRRIF